MASGTNFDRDEYTSNANIKKLWRIKSINRKTVIELRAINSTKTICKLFKASEYASKQNLILAFEKEALRLNQLDYNIYYVMNPIREDFAGKSATDADIISRELLLIDIDRVGHKRQSSTDIELEAARLLSEQIADFLKSEGWNDPIRMMSGNGYHLYYVLNKLPNDLEHKILVEALLRELAAKFNNNIVNVDTVVFNASRITKVPGTIARKGSNTEERPHRMAVIL